MPLHPICTLLLLLPTVADAASLYKCVARSGAVSYQSEPCAAATARVWEATPQPPPDTAELARRQQAEQRGQADSRYLSRLAGTDRPGGARAYAIRLGDGRDCDVARERRERKLAAVGMERDYALVSALNDAVFEACK
ncbi:MULTISPECIES: DUF4124 domain-containing protein [unclassified Lysobacter]|uniref:DUF4124 domain-containing protein n=1 Tax=unclassified Lysobacter TaxID=2635362 RepID=UPI0006F7F27F|nr:MULTISPECIES: DUF4124 domain-containing protein [unclassified Lysobacter]KRA20763.1 hypothetical protein ASD69_05505 [Lysobacter sp. Root604]KRD39774.1 hypothetical protein ASE35_05480 [Lysobacter sp. Root916]KRD79796.1 hypothetical protein ASE43_02540 [Lysobacter sp. Root983]